MVRGRLLRSRAKSIQVGYRARRGVPNAIFHTGSAMPCPQPKTAKTYPVEALTLAWGVGDRTMIAICGPGESGAAQRFSRADVAACGRGHGRRATACLRRQTGAGGLCEGWRSRGGDATELENWRATVASWRKLAVAIDRMLRRAKRFGGVDAWVFRVSNIAPIAMSMAQLATGQTPRSFAGRRFEKCFVPLCGFSLHGRRG